RIWCRSSPCPRRPGDGRRTRGGLPWRRSAPGQASALRRPWRTKERTRWRGTPRGGSNDLDDTARRVLLIGWICAPRRFLCRQRPNRLPLANAMWPLPLIRQHAIEGDSQRLEDSGSKVIGSNGSVFHLTRNPVGAAVDSSAANTAAREDDAVRTRPVVT